MACKVVFLLFLIQEHVLFVFFNGKHNMFIDGYHCCEIYCFFLDYSRSFSALLLLCMLDWFTVRCHVEYEGCEKDML